MMMMAFWLWRTAAIQETVGALSPPQVFYSYVYGGATPPASNKDASKTEVSKSCFSANKKQEVQYCRERQALPWSFRRRREAVILLSE